MEIDDPARSAAIDAAGQKKHKAAPEILGVSPVEQGVAGTHTTLPGGELVTPDGKQLPPVFAVFQEHELGLWPRGLAALYPAGAVAAVVGISRVRVWQLANEGRIRALKLGNNCLIVSADDVVERNAQPGRPKPGRPKKIQPTLDP